MDVSEILIPLIWKEGPAAAFQLKLGLEVVPFTGEFRRDWLKPARDPSSHRALYMATHVLHGSAPKTPQRVLMNHESQRVEDFFTALRLHVAGDIARGPQYLRALIDGKLNESGYLFHPMWELPIRLIDSKVTSEDLAAAETLGKRIGELRATNENLALALRRFNYSYSRELPADELLDLTVGLESLFAADGPGEIGFKIAARSARLLSRPPEAHQLELARALYRVRSEIVHGGHYERLHESKSFKKLAETVGTRPATSTDVSDAGREAARNFVRAALRTYVRHDAAGSAQEMIRRLDLA